MQDLDSFPIARMDKYIKTFENLLISGKKKQIVSFCGVGLGERAIADMTPPPTTLFR